MRRLPKNGRSRYSAEATLLASFTVAAEPRYACSPAVAPGEVVPLTSRGLLPTSFDSEGQAADHLISASVGPISPRLQKDESAPLESWRFHHPCRFISWESEELDELPNALFLATGRKSLGSC